MGITKAQKRVRYRELVADGICPICYQPVDGSTVKCSTCRTRHNAAKRKRSKEHGTGRFSVPRTHYHMTPADITKACGMYTAEGKSIAVVAAELNWPRSRVRAAVIKGGGKLRGRCEALQTAVTNGRFAARPRPSRCSWKGGKRKTEHGYVHVWVNDPEHHRGGRYVFEHRLIWEAQNGSLPKGWIVHHINGIKDDNRLENLVACHKRDHAAMWEFVCAHIQHLEREVAELKTDVEALRRQRSRTT